MTSLKHFIYCILVFFICNTLISCLPDTVGPSRIVLDSILYHENVNQYGKYHYENGMISKCEYYFDDKLVDYQEYVRQSGLLRTIETWEKQTDGTFKNTYTMFWNMKTAFFQASDPGMLAARIHPIISWNGTVKKSPGFTIIRTCLKYLFILIPTWNMTSRGT